MSEILSVTRSAFTVFTLILLSSFITGDAVAGTPDTSKVSGMPFMDSSLPRDKRVKDLISRLTVKEKIGLVGANAVAVPRLGIPKYHYWNECLHGVARSGIATVFPQAIGLAATWDTALIFKTADVISTEARAKHHDFMRNNKHGKYQGLTFWSPNINIFRDPRWGRGQETYGEDPFLTGEIAKAFVHGIQGDDPNYYKAAACAKHFAVHNGPEASRHKFDSKPSERDLYETYLPQFQTVVKDTGVASVMGAYNSLYGIPCCASSFLLQKLLRDKWGFKGQVVSDCGAIKDIWKNHKYKKTAAEASAAAVKAGCDLNCGNTYKGGIAAALKEGILKEADLDKAVYRNLELRFKLGMFDSPDKVPYASIPITANDTEAHRQLALKTASESIVLLKNNGILPLSKSKIKSIAIIGPNAEAYDVLYGNYNGKASKPVNLLSGIQAKCKKLGITTVYTIGCSLIPEIWKKDKASLKKAADKAIQIAGKADIIVFAGGINPRLEGEENKGVQYKGFYKGDRTKIELPDIQTSLLKQLSALGKPVIYVNFSGSSMAFPWIKENIPAVIQAWYPGEEGGTAIADIIFGDVNPAGRLPVTFYESTSNLPDFENYSMKNRTYKYFTGKTLYPFGHGLSFTTFEYLKATSDKQEIPASGSLKISVTVKNTGKMDGDEVVQIYFRKQKPASGDPVRSLCAFRRIHLRTGEARTVSISIPAERFRYWDTASHAYKVAPGIYILEVAASSEDIRAKVPVSIK